MAWNETCVVDRRYEFVVKALSKEKPFAELCREYDIAPKNGRKWVKRFKSEGISGLSDRSRRPKTNSRSPDEEILLEIVRIRATKGWGCGANLRPLLLRKHPAERVPSESTIDRVLKKAGLIQPRKRRRVGKGERIQIRARAEKPNDIWTIDYKGWWRTKDLNRVQPLTLRDDFSRYILGLQGMRQIRWELVKEIMTDIFVTYGLPEVIRSDNGAPFAHSESLGGLTQLSAWWVALGIMLDRIDPGRPDQNGGHERMHLDLKRQVQRRPEVDLALQQAIFDEWKFDFNTVKPHSALSFQTPASVYCASDRKYPGAVDLQYPDHFEVRKVSTNGKIRHRNDFVYISRALSGWDIGLEEQEDGKLNVWFAELLLGTTDKHFWKKLSPASPKPVPMS